MLISVDVGGTLGTFESPSVPDLLARLSPLSRSAIAEYDRQFLHPAPELTDELVSQMCRMLTIRRSSWSDLGAPGQFTAFDYASEALARLAALAPVVTLSNVSIVAAPLQMVDVREQLGRHLGAIYTSCQLAMRKPDCLCWQRIASEHAVPVDDIVHIGDRLTEDVRGALFAGCRGVVFTNTRKESVPADLLCHPNVAVVQDLSASIRVVEAWVASP